MKKQKLQMKKRLSGFSIMEVMISMFVISVGLLSTIALFSSGFINSTLDRDRIIAAGLAQEGVELVKNVRDNSLATGDTVGFGNFSSTNQHHCRMSYDTNAASPINCSNNSTDTPGNNPNRYDLNAVGGYYSHSNGSNTKFSRYIYIDYSSANRTADVTAFVYWGSAVPSGIQTGDTANCHIGNRCVYSKMRLEAWKP